MKGKRLLAGLLTLALMISMFIPHATAHAGTLTDMTQSSGWPTPPTIESASAILIDAKNGNILYSKKANKKRHPASITKVMTALIVLENCSLDETVTFSYRATHDLEPGSTTIARTEGEEMTVEECLYALLLQSANEVAQGLAEHVAGSIEDFAVMMNEKAEELGCTKTHFTNPSGLNDDDHYTTCHDMALIMQAAVQNSDFLRIESANSYTIAPTNKHEEETIVAQKHKLVKSGSDHYDGAVAGKTGYTTQTGHTLVTYAVRGDMELICVIMRSDGTQYADTRALFDYGFDNFSMKNMADTDAKETILDEIQSIQSSLPVSSETEIAENSGEDAVEDTQGTSSELTVLDLSAEELEQAYISDADWLLLPYTLDYSSLTREVLLSDATIKAGEDVPLATITYSNGDTVYGTGTMYLNYTPPATEEAAETEETAAVPATGKGIAVISAVARGFRTICARIAGFFISLYQRFGLLLFVGIAVIILLLILFHIFRNGLRRRQKKYSGPYFTSKPRRYGRHRNKYHMKK